MKSGHGVPSADTASAGEYSFGPFRLDVRKRRLWKGDQLVALTPKAFETLLALVRHAGQVVDKDDLLQIVWPGTFITEETLTQNIATIRRALGDSSENPKYIATLPRRGYQFIEVVAHRSTDAIPLVAASDVSKVESSVHTRYLGAPSTERRLPIGLLVAMVVSVGLGIAFHVRSRAPETSSYGGEWHIDPPPGTVLRTGGVLSPDGKSVAFVTVDALGTTSLWVQTLGSVDPVRLPGTNQARAPFWSPDGKSIIFSAFRQLKRIGLTDKNPQTLANVVSLAPFLDRGGASSPSGVILLAGMERGPLQRLKADGTFEPVTRLETGDRTHLWPSFLPDGRHFLYRAGAFEVDHAGTYIGSLDVPGERTSLDTVSSAAVYASGYLLFARDGALVAQRFDPDWRRLDGTPVLVAPNVAPPLDIYGMTFSAAGDVISYISGDIDRQLAWFDRAGRRLGVLDKSNWMNQPSLSPDDALAAVARSKPEADRDIWIVPTKSGTPWRLETGVPRTAMPVWSRDGQRIAFTSDSDLYAVPATGGRANLLLKGSTDARPLLQDWSPDGRFLLYIFFPPSPAQADLWLFSLADSTARPFVDSSAVEMQGQFSPDGHWIAYASNETGNFEIYVGRFPDGEDKQKISVNGGAQPQWRGDGKELFYLSLENKLMSVDLDWAKPRPFGIPNELFQIPLYETLDNRRNNYAVSRDGTRFLFNVPPPHPPPITVRLNWTAALPK
jgi:Tol biopolymer transport system component/DNA-binding winged helix-turn-helix (wHTH) protein